MKISSTIFFILRVFIKTRTIVSTDIAKGTFSQPPFDQGKVINQIPFPEFHVMAVRSRQVDPVLRRETYAFSAPLAASDRMTQGTYRILYHTPSGRKSQTIFSKGWKFPVSASQNPLYWDIYRKRKAIRWKAKLIGRLCLPYAHNLPNYFLEYKVFRVPTHHTHQSG